jgi:pyruvate dehydrogenase E2 component (dihydrolipoamide acetyltransferase)
MATDVIMPALGVAQEKGTLLHWLKTEGQSVVKGEPLMEIETDKATVEIEAPASGVLAQVSAAAGDEVPVGQRIALILAPGEVANKDQGRVSVSTSLVKPVIQPNPPISPFVKGGSKGDFLASETSLLARGRLLASPAAKRIGREKGIDLATLQGSGPEGSVLAQDVLRAAEGGARPAAAAAQALMPLSTMRRIVGQRMTESKQAAPHFYVSVDIDMTAVNQIRAAWKERAERAVPSINDFILQACARALKDFPSLNSTYTEQGIVIHPDINIGMAVALEEGLVVPVIRNADRLSLVDLARTSRELIDKAQKRKLFPMDYDGGTFTLSNLGMLGADSFIAIINPPQCAILAVGKVAPRVVADGEAVVIRSFMTATLSADHRVVDGAIAARFLQEVKGLLESARE